MGAKAVYAASGETLTNPYWAGTDSERTLAREIRRSSTYARTYVRTYVEAFLENHYVFYTSLV